MDITVIHAVQGETIYYKVGGVYELLQVQTGGHDSNGWLYTYFGDNARSENAYIPYTVALN